jgi:hypothetical protein
LLLSEDPEAEQSRILSSTAADAATDHNNLKLPVRMSFPEFSALVEIIRMHKKKFRALEKHQARK